MGSKSISKTIKISGLIYIAATIILALFYLQERVFYIDSAAQVFEIILNKGFAVYVGRYSMYVQQLLPVLAVNLGLPLMLVAALYSLAAPLITLVCLGLCIYKFKNNEASIAIILSGTIVGHEFFHGISETAQLIPYVAVFYASLKQYLQNVTILAFLWPLSFLLLSYFIHPISVLLLGFCFVSLGIRFWNKKWSLLPLFGVLLVIFGVKTALTSMGIIAQHDSQFLSNLIISPQEITSFFSFPIIQQLKPVFFELYGLTLAFAIIALASATYLKNRLIWIELVIAMFFVLIASVVFRNEASPLAISARFMPLALFFAISSRAYFKKANRYIKIIVIILPLGFIYNVVQAGKFYLKRSAVIERYIELGRDAGKQKYYFIPVAEELPYNDIGWGVAIESILRSSLWGNRTITIYPRTDLIHPNIILTKDPIYNNVTWWKYRSDEDLNKTGYFKLSGLTYPLIDWDGIESFKYTGQRKLDGSQNYLSDDARIVFRSTDNWIKDGNRSLMNLNPNQKGAEFSVQLAPIHSYGFYVNSSGTIKIEAINTCGIVIKEEGNGLVELNIPAADDWLTYDVSIENVDTVGTEIDQIEFIKHQKP